MAKRRWLVVTSVSSMSAIALGLSPLLTFTYYRWKWLARLSAAMDNCAPAFSFGAYVSARCIGRVTAKAR